MAKRNKRKRKKQDLKAKNNDSALRAPKLPSSLKRTRTKKIRLLVLLTTLIALLAPMAYYGFLNLTQPTIPQTILWNETFKVRTQLEDNSTSFTLTPQPPAGLPYRLSLSSSAGPLIYEGKTQEDFSLIVPYVRAGQTPYKLSVAQQYFEGSFNREPLTAVTPLKLEPSARAYRINGSQRPSVVIHALDKHGNIASDPLELKVISSSGLVESQTLITSDLLAFAELPTPTEIGKLYVTASSRSARAERLELDLLAGEPKFAHFVADKSDVPASGRDAWELRLHNGLDSSFQRVNEGNLALIYGGNDDLDFFISQPLNQGAVSLKIPSFPQAAEFDLQAQTGLYKSEPLTVIASPIIKNKPDYVFLDDPYGLSLGPFYDLFGAIPDNGSEALLQFLNTQGEILFSSTLGMKNGYLNIIFPPLPKEANNLRVRVAGEWHAFDLVKRLNLSEASQVTEGEP